MKSLFFVNIFNPCCSRLFIQSTIYLNKLIIRFYSQQDKPLMYQLEHVQKRLEFTTPLMFKMRMDYTFLRKDVFLDDQIMGVTRSGLNEIMHHFGTIAVAGNLLRANIDAQALNIVPILEDGTVRLQKRNGGGAVSDTSQKEQLNTLTTINSMDKISELKNINLKENSGSMYSVTDRLELEEERTARKSRCVL
uniref:Uncharacterized protein n=1 Tax=Meloidogyne floridensis TaxID=298350 RepID=A0A915PCT0_9BILA